MFVHESVTLISTLMMMMMMMITIIIIIIIIIQLRTFDVFSDDENRLSKKVKSQTSFTWFAVIGWPDRSVAPSDTIIILTR